MCPGKQISLICHTDQDQFLKWNVYVPYYNMSYSKIHAYQGIREVTHTEVDPMVTLTFERISESDTLPLVSQLSINNIAALLNETMITCTEQSLRNIKLRRAIHIIDTTHGMHKLNLNIYIICQICSLFYTLIHCMHAAETINPPLITQAEQITPNHVIIFLEWMEETGLLYNINATVIPEVNIRSIRRNLTQLTLSYNTLYTVNVSATLCGHSEAWTLLNFTYSIYYI